MTPIVLKTKAVRDVSRRDLIGDGNWVFYQLIQVQASFQSEVASVKIDRRGVLKSIHLSFSVFFTIEYAHYTESMGQEVGDSTNARDVIQLRFAF